MRCDPAPWRCTEAMINHIHLAPSSVPTFIARLICTISKNNVEAQFNHTKLSFNVQYDTQSKDFTITNEAHSDHIKLRDKPQSSLHEAYHKSCLRLIRSRCMPRMNTIATTSQCYRILEITPQAHLTHKSMQHMSSSRCLSLEDFSTSITKFRSITQWLRANQTIVDYKAHSSDLLQSKSQNIIRKDIAASFSACHISARWNDSELLIEVELAALLILAGNQLNASTQAFHTIMIVPAIYTCSMTKLNCCGIFPRQTQL